MLRRSHSLVATTLAVFGCDAGVLSTENDVPVEFGSVSTRSSFTLARLPVPAGFTTGRALAVNERGDIVGSVDVAPAEPRAILWSAGEVVLLPGLGGPTSGAEDINNRGDIVGHADNPDGQPRAVLWRDGVPQDLGTLGGAFSFAEGINERGQIVGASETASGDVHAFLWERGTMTDLGRLPLSEFSRAHDINERGTVVGWSAGGSHVQSPTVWDDGEIIELATLGHEGGAFAINMRGQIVGGTFPFFQTHARATLWEDDAVIDLGSLVDDFSSASGINNRGQVVGVSAGTTCAQCPFLWERGIMVNLGTDGALFGSADDINNRGLIVGTSGLVPVVWTTGRTTIAGASTAKVQSGDIVAQSYVPARERAAWAVTYCQMHRDADSRPSAIGVAARC